MLQLGDGKCIRVDNMCVGELVVFFSLDVYVVVIGSMTTTLCDLNFGILLVCFPVEGIGG